MSHGRRGPHKTRHLTTDFTQIPTGAIYPLDWPGRLVGLCLRRWIHILHDGNFSGPGETGGRHLPFVADTYERGLSPYVMSQAYGLPGLRIGWIA